MTACRGLGVIFVFLALATWVCSFYKLWRCSKKTTGILVGVDVRSEMTAGKSWRNYYVPLYVFEVDGKVYKGEGKAYNTSPDYFKPNTPCEIRYNPLNPNESLYEGKTGNIVVGFIFLVFGLFLFYIGKNINY